MSQLNVDTIEPEGASTTLTLGASGDTVTIPSGATIDASAGTVTGFASGLASVQTFTSSGTWTRPSGITKVVMEVQGAGGSGGTINGSYASPGAAGGYAKKFLNVSSISSSTITIGSGGAGVTSGDGNNGGSSSWSDGTNTITCGGGSGGDGSTNYYAKVGGTATGGDINIPGGDGNYSRSEGRDSMFGFGGPDSVDAASFTGGSSPNARGYGAGGSASYTSTSGNGGGGIVIVWEYK
jgi:hypothetical protein